MIVTIELEPEIEKKLNEKAQQQGQSLPEYIQKLIREGVSAKRLESEARQDDEGFEPDFRIAASIEEARRRIHALMDSNPGFAAAMGPSGEEEPAVDDQLPEEAYTRRAGDEVFEERYGRELTARMIVVNLKHVNDVAIAIALRHCSPKPDVFLSSNKQHWKSSLKDPVGGIEVSTVKAFLGKLGC